MTESERASESSVESVVLLHGFGGTRRAWDGVLAHLPGERYRPLALDLPGHGEQTDAPRPITFEGCVESVLERSPERFVLAGYSLGGRIALHVALAVPERIERLVLISTTAGIEDVRERARRRERDRRLADEIERGPIEAFVARWRAQPMFAADPPEVDALARADQLRNDPGAVAAVLRGVGTGEMQPLWGRLNELTMPVVIVVGERDAKFHSLGLRMEASIPRATLVVAGGGHVLPIENRIAVAVAIGATVVHMPRTVSIRELRNSTAAVVSKLEAGERLTLTVNRRPVADILPHVQARTHWVPAAELRRIVLEAPADPSLLEDLAEIRGAELEDS